ncbi:phosphatidylethanolamine-binding protein [Patellaria atrata CBS 101060]|uniref:Phosphatidylethanolamine-binding protein n=1 Tax=Patellaria atrata CBS 101060 TaxID=1346257 RepID=A0A9P4S513_9PEZI|nr:phosphatidylethanolamine-binding protein [Patellaria atrata CBS 101060]
MAFKAAFRGLLFAFNLLTAINALPTEQQVLHTSTHHLDVISELEKAEIIPTVIDTFIPRLTLNISWPSNETAHLGNTISPDDTQDKPNITLYDPSDLASSSSITYTVTLTDPDAPSRDDPEWSEMCHWIATNVKVSSSALSVDEIMEYKPPGPPPKTGKHRYVFIAFAPANGTSDELHLSKPEDRQHWGYEYDGRRVGVRKWAAENGLVPVGSFALT